MLPQCPLEHNTDRIAANRKKYFEDNPRPKGHKTPQNGSTNNKYKKGQNTFAGVAVFKTNKNGEVVTDVQGLRKLQAAAATKAADAIHQVIQQKSTSAGSEPAPAPAPAPAASVQAEPIDANAALLGLENLRSTALKAGTAKDDESTKPRRKGRKRKS